LAVNTLASNHCLLCSTTAVGVKTEVWYFPGCC